MSTVETFLFTKVLACVDNSFEPGQNEPVPTVPKQHGVVQMDLDHVIPVLTRSISDQRPLLTHQALALQVLGRLDGLGGLNGVDGVDVVGVGVVGLVHSPLERQLTRRAVLAAAQRVLFRSKPGFRR